MLRETLDTCTTRNMNNILFSIFTIAKLKPKKYPGAHHQKSGWCIAAKTNKLQWHATIWMNLSSTILSENSQKVTYSRIPFIKWKHFKENVNIVDRNLNANKGKWILTTCNLCKVEIFRNRAGTFCFVTLLRERGRDEHVQSLIGPCNSIMTPKWHFQVKADSFKNVMSSARSIWTALFLPCIFWGKNHYEGQLPEFDNLHIHWRPAGGRSSRP